MSRKDYEALAAALNAAREDVHTILGGHHAVQLAAGYVATVLAKDNPRFDRERFMRAAGFEAGPQC